jgi:hypothetical protein
VVLAQQRVLRRGQQHLQAAVVMQAAVNTTA